VTAPATTGIPLPTTHEHGWIVESAHRTLDGRVLYVRCDVCGTRRVDLEPHTVAVPGALSRELRDAAAS
jgi:hypothetical protein